MTKKQRIELEFARKTYDAIPTAEMREKVTELEEILAKRLDIWGDEEQYSKFQRLQKLNLSDRRLVLVYSILGGSIIKTASYFKVNRRTIETNLIRIKQELGIND